MLYSTRARRRERESFAGAFFMTRNRLLLISFAALALAAALAGCGGGSGEEVPDDAIAVVDGTEVTKADFDGLIDQAERSYESQKRPFPKAGTPEYAALKNQAVSFLVQRAQFDRKAEEFEVEVTDKQVADRLEEIKKQYFDGDQKKYEAQIKQQGLTEEQVRRDVRAQLVQEALFKKVTDQVKVDDKAVEDYYAKNKSQYTQPESREVRHILVSSKKLADDLRAQLEAGGDFAALAKKHSKDPGSKDQGGKLTVSRGQTVPPFDKAAFALAVNELSQPIKTQYGFHLIEPLSAVKPSKVTPLKDVKQSIREQLSQTKKNDAMTKWVEETKKELEDETEYQAGYAPPTTSTGTTSGSTTNG
jgi:parvulin-like peptidyl-prolyl isomerase